MRNGRVILSIVVTCFLMMPPAHVFAADPYFDDVPETHWAYDYVQRLFEGGITTGCDATHYCPENDVTRAQMAAFLMRTVDLLRGANIGIVDTSGNNYADPVEAMDDLDSWCGVPSSTNPCLLKILPGVYDLGQESLQMQGYVDIQGAGKNITTIRGNTGVNDSGVVNGADNAVLSHVRVVNTGGGTYAIALYNNNASPGILHVTAKASNGGTYSRGIYNVSSSPAISNVNVVVSGGVSSEGIVNNTSSSPVIRRVTVDSMGGGTNSRGIYNVLSSPVLINVTARASGATNNYGVYSTSSGSTIRIEQSRLIGATTIWNGSGVTTYVAHTRLQGGSVNNAGVLKCVGAYNGAFDALDGNCGLP